MNRRWGPLATGTSWVLATTLLLGFPGPGLVVAATASAGASAGGGLSVETNPAGASVYVDGAKHGETPLSVETLAPGDHRVRVVKDGYLENSRVVSIRSNQKQAVQVTLTPDKGPVRQSLQVEERGKQGGGGGGKKALWIGLAAVAVGAGVFLLLPKNSPPVVTSVAATVDGASAASISAISGISTVSFSCNCSDKDNDPLTYTWNFGDGETGSGASPTHLYNQAGAFNVSVTVSDGKKSATGNTSVTVKSISGTWRGSIFGFTFTLNLTQNGTSFSGSWTDTVGRTSGVTGRLTAPRKASFEFSRFIDVWSLDADSAVNVLSGRGSTVFGSYTVTATRQ